MVRYLIFLSLLSFSVALLAQQTDFPKVNWHNAIGSGNESITYTTDADGNLYTFGKCNYDIIWNDSIMPCQINSVFLSKTDSSGNLLWVKHSQRFRGDGVVVGFFNMMVYDEDLFLSFLVAGEGGYSVAFGEDSLEKKHEISLYNMRLDTDGHLLWVQEKESIGYESEILSWGIDKDIIYNFSNFGYYKERVEYGSSVDSCIGGVLYRTDLQGNPIDFISFKTDKPKARADIKFAHIDTQTHHIFLTVSIDSAFNGTPYRSTDPVQVTFGDTTITLALETDFVSLIKLDQDLNIIWVKPQVFGPQPAPSSYSRLGYFDHLNIVDTHEGTYLLAIYYLNVLSTDSLLYECPAKLINMFFLGFLSPDGHCQWLKTGTDLPRHLYHRPVCRGPHNYLLLANSMSAQSSFMPENWAPISYTPKSHENQVYLGLFDTKGNVLQHHIATSDPAYPVSTQVKSILCNGRQTYLTVKFFMMDTMSFEDNRWFSLGLDWNASTMLSLEVEFPEPPPPPPVLNAGLWPNPGSDLLTCRVEEGNAITRVEAWTPEGRLVYPFDLDATITHTLQTNQWASGLYFIRLYTQQGTICYKWVKI